MAKKETNKDNPLVIPFGKAARVGNFKLWRGNYVIGSGKEKTAIETVHVSDLDGGWTVRIPETSPSFGFICNQFATVDETLRDNILGMVFTNMRNLCLTPSEALHDAFWFLSEMMTFPYMLLSEKEMEKRMKESMKASGMEKDKAKEHIAQMMDYRRQLYELIERKKTAYIEEYERQQKERWEKEPEAQKQLEQDEIAEQAIDILNKEGED